MNISPNSIAHVNIMNSVLHGNAPTEEVRRFSAYQEPSPLPSRAFVPLNGVSGSSHQEIEGGGDISKMNGVMDAASKKLRFYNQDPIRDPYAQISNSGFTPIGNLKTYWELFKNVFNPFFNNIFISYHKRPHLKIFQNSHILKKLSALWHKTYTKLDKLKCF